MPLTQDNTGIGTGQSANATVSVELQDLIWYGAPLSLYDTEPPMDGGAGSLVIQNSVTSTTGSSSGQTNGQIQAYLPYGLMVSGAFLMLAAVFLSRQRSP